MESFDFKSWKHFRDNLNAYAEADGDRRSDYLFRGQPSAAHLLSPTIDRVKRFSSDSDRDRVSRQLQGKFRSELLRGQFDHVPDEDSEGLEILARHYGVPSQLLDWTESPYIAAYFAFFDVDPLSVDRVAIWRLDRAELNVSDDKVKLLDDLDLLRFNPRALHQRGVLMRVASIETPLSELLGNAVLKMTIPAADRGQALSDLDEMTINALSLFSGMEGAAQTATWRVLG